MLSRIGGESPASRSIQSLSGRDRLMRMLADSFWPRIGKQTSEKESFQSVEFFIGPGLGSALAGMPTTPATVLTRDAAVHLYQQACLVWRWPVLRSDHCLRRCH